MNLMNLLMLFVMIGIGADDLFVVCGSFQKAKGTIAERVEQVFDEAFAACFITTWTTAFGFSANSSSSIAPIRDFAVCSTLVVVFNYLLVVTWVPAWLVVIESWKKKKCLPACRLRGSLCLPPRSQIESDVQPTRSRAFAVFPKLNLEGNLVAIMEGSLSNFVFRSKYMILSTSCLLFVFCLDQASQLQPAKGTPELFPATHPVSLGRFGRKAEKATERYRNARPVSDFKYFSTTREPFTVQDFRVSTFWVR
jgi:hypothetical protein